MKIKQEIEWVEWVADKPPETESLKIISVDDNGQVFTASGRYYSEFDDSKPRWTWENGIPIPATIKVLAWASMPHYQGFPAEGQKVEFADAYRCDQKHPDPVVERLIEAVGFLGKESERRLWSEFEDPDHKYGSDLDKLKHLDVYVRTGKVEA